jgi:hypothetical protein
MTERKDHLALEADWNRIMDALGADETDVALEAIRKLREDRAVAISLVESGTQELIAAVAERNAALAREKELAEAASIGHTEDAVNVGRGPCRLCDALVRYRGVWSLMADQRNDPAPFDPDDMDKAVDTMTPARFAALVAQVVREHPNSGYWLLVNRVIEKETGWDAEHAQVERLVERMAREGDHNA